MARLMDRLMDIPDSARLRDILVDMVEGHAISEDLDFIESRFVQIVERAPTDELERAIHHTVEKLSPKEIEPEAASALESLSDEERVDLGFRLFEGLRVQALNPTDAAQAAGVPDPDPATMTPDQFGKLVRYIVATRPNALGDALSLQPSLTRVLGHTGIASVLMHLANEILGGEPLYRTYPERPGQPAINAQGPPQAPQGSHVPEREWEQTTTGGLHKPSVNPPKSDRG